MTTNSNLWLIEPERYLARAESYNNLSADKEFLKESAEFRGEGPLRLDGTERVFELRDGVSIIDFAGPITNESSFFSFLFGEAVLPMIAARLRAADADPDVKAHILRMDSPGGPPAGLEEFNATIAGLNKPVIGFSDGMIASGAMWAASALDGIVVTRTASVGSIGVIAIIMEFTKMLEQDGVKATVIRAGKLKAIGNRFEALTDEGESMIQAEVDHLHSVFIETVAEGLGVSVEEITKVADGRLFIGQQAVDAGLVDKIGLLNDAIEMALNINNGGTTMGEIKSVSELRTEYPELCAEVVAAVELPDVSAAVTAETDRVTGLAVAHFGEEIGGKFTDLVKLGVDVAQYNSMRELMPVAETDADLKAKHLEALELLKVEDPGTGAKVEGPATFKAAYEAIKAEKGCTTMVAMSLAAKEFPELHEAQKTGGAK